MSVFVLLWLVFLAAGQRALFQDPGTFWHVATGQRMWAAGRVLDRDPFGFLSFGRPWVPMQWLSELGMAKLYDALGLDGLLLAASALLALNYTLLWRAVRARGLSPGLATLLTTVAAAASSHHFIARPHLFTLLFVGLVQLVLMRWEDTGRSAKLWLLAPCFLLWVNLHGGAAGGLVMVLIVVLVHYTRAAFAGLPPGKERWLPGGLALVLCALPFANPFGAALPRTWLSLSSSRVLPQVIKEHLAPDLGTPGQWLFVLLAVLYTGLLASVPRRSLRASWLLPLLWLLLSLRSVRHIPLFAQVAALTLPALIMASPRARSWFAARSGPLFLLGAPLRTPAVWVALTSSSLVLCAVVLVLLRGWARPSPEVAPYDVLPALQAAAQDVPAGSGILNEMTQGGFLMLHVPRLRVYIDDRWEVHGDAELSAYVRDSAQHPERLVARAHELGMPLALAPRNSPLERELERTHHRLLARGLSVSLFDLHAPSER